MAHVRQQIRDALVTRLTGLPTCGSRVYAGRDDNFALSELPAINISTLNQSEQVARQSVHFPARLQRDLPVIVMGFVKATTANLENALDALAVELEAAIAGSTIALSTFSALLPNGMVLTESRATIDQSFEEPVGRLELVYTATYSTSSNAPQVAL